MSISVIVATYGSYEWEELGKDRAAPSAWNQDCGVVIYHDHKGTVASSRNAGADLADKVEWLCFLDADDELSPGYIAAMEKSIQELGGYPDVATGGNKRASYGAAAKCGGSHPAPTQRTLFTPAVQTVRPGRTPGPPSFFREVPLRQANWLVIGTLIHRDLFWEVGGFPEAEHGLEDWGLWSKCARVGAEVVKVPDAVYRYWVSPQSMHRVLWRDKTKQREAHRRVARELDEWEAARA